jgi:hypothetical protein
MSDAPLEPLDADLQALVVAERQRPDVPAGVRDRLLDRLGHATTGGTGGGGGDAGSGAGGELPMPARVGRFFGRRVPLAVTAFAVGGLVGAGVHATLSRPAPAISAPVALSRPAEPAPQAAPESVPAAPAAPPEPQATSTAPDVNPAVPRRPGRPSAPAHPSDSAGEPDTELAAERAFVETARAAVARGDASAALEALERGGRQFPSGRLVEERESLRIHALAKVGRSAEARALGARFHRDFPHSMLLPMVDAALATIP